MTWNPFDWTAEPFLAFYVALAAIVFVLGFRSRLAIGPAAPATRQLSVLELACLSGGASRLGDAVLLGLASGNGATIDPNGQKITVTDLTPLTALMGRPPVLSVQPDITRQQFQTAVTPIVEQVQQRLRELGYCPTEAQITSFRTTVLPFVGLLMVFGMIKVVVGSERHHPVGILVFLLFATAFAGIMLATKPMRTRAGKDLLQSYQASHARAARAPLDHELLFSVALSGVVVLSGTPYAPVQAAAQTMSGSSGGDGSGGSCGGGGGGGGCGGCSG